MIISGYSSTNSSLNFNHCPSSIPLPYTKGKQTVWIRVRKITVRVFITTSQLLQVLPSHPLSSASLPPADTLDLQKNTQSQQNHHLRVQSSLLLLQTPESRTIVSFHQSPLLEPTTNTVPLTIIPAAEGTKSIWRTMMIVANAMTAMYTVPVRQGRWWRWK